MTYRGQIEGWAGQLGTRFVFIEVSDSWSDYGRHMLGKKVRLGLD